MMKIPSVDMKRILNIIYVMVLAVILLFPVFLLNFKKDLKIDNRPAEKFPDLTWRNLTDIPRQFERWFGDRFGGRKNFISLGNMLLCKVFHESPNEHIALGSDGFIFLASHNAGIENKNSLIRQLFVFNRKQVDDEASRFGRFLEGLEKSRIPVRFITVPSKHLLYFDKMPADIKKNLSGPNVFFNAEVEREIVRRYPKAAAKYFVDLRSEALKAVRKIDLIPAGNFHWIPGPYTHLAANLVARSLGATNNVLVLNPGRYRTVLIKSDLRHFMYHWMRTSALETSDVDFEALGIKVSLGLGNLQKRGPLPPVANKLIYHSTNPKAKKGRILLIGDSFTNPLCQDMARCFREVVTIEYSALLRVDPKHAREWLKEVVAAYDPQYIVAVSYVCAVFWIEDIAATLDVQQARRPLKNGVPIRTSGKPAGRNSGCRLPADRR